MTAKICRECGVEKELSLFVAQRTMADGYLNQCKQCIAISKKAWVARNPNKVRSYINRYNGTSRGRAAQKKRADKLKTIPGYAKKIAKQAQIRALKYPLKLAAHKAVRLAKEQGRLSPAKNCSRCQSSKNVDGHHEDYTNQLDVIWLCKSCHGLRHQEINELTRNGEDWSEKGF